MGPSASLSLINFVEKSRVALHAANWLLTFRNLALLELPLEGTSGERGQKWKLITHQ